jgi:hypothetical protein
MIQRKLKDFNNYKTSLRMSYLRRDKALQLAFETQAAILSDTLNVSTILRRCLTICQLLDREDKNKWIKIELNGLLRFV